MLIRHPPPPPPLTPPPLPIPTTLQKEEHQRCRDRWRGRDKLQVGIDTRRQTNEQHAISNEAPRPTIFLSVDSPLYKTDPYYLLTRRVQVTVFRLGTGHNCLDRHLYIKLRIGHTEQCPFPQGEMKVDLVETT